MKYPVQSFESYNARFVDPRTIAETFILREKEFHQLCEQNNSLLVGPRGSGKTTLLKMLKVGAQIAWKHSREANALRRFHFAPIHVGADRQLDLVISGADVRGPTGRTIELLAKALLSFRVKFACLDTAREISNPNLVDIPSLSHQFVSLEGREDTLCRLLSKVWDLGDTALSFLEINARLQWQLAEINRIVERIKYDEEVQPQAIVERAQYLTHDPIQSCQAFVSTFNDVTDSFEKTWALCIDELEIMPEQIQRYLFSCLRSVDHRIVLKLATSPFSGIDWDRFSVARPMAGHDFTAINLAFTKKSDGRRNEARRFSARLLDAMIAAEGGFRGRDRPRGRTVLGQSPISEANTTESQRGAYRPPDGEHFSRFRRLQEVDPAFRQFLADRQVDLRQIHEEGEDRRAGQVRKHIWHVAVRLEYGPSSVPRGLNTSIGDRPRSRKAIPEIYLGFDSLITMCEGNPRMTIALLRPLVRRFLGTGRPVPFEDQSVTVEEAVAKYVSLLSTIRFDDGSGRNKNLSVVNLIDAIGDFFAQEVNGPIFKSEPLLTFRVDQSLSKSYIEAIGSAMNQGAFIMISDESGLFDFGSIQRARLRLSYLLCPLYHLPLILGGQIKLSRIIASRGRASERIVNQDDLFARLTNG
jgi:energy-coupling factor transporter ATP-binding protein EcfA2